MTTARPPFFAPIMWAACFGLRKTLRAREQRQQGMISAEALRAIEDRWIR